MRTFLILAALAALAFGCSSNQSTTDQAGGAATPGATTASATTEAAPAPALEDFAAARFEAPTAITNPWMPMKPGMRWVYEGVTVEDDGTAVPHRFESIVTDLVKEIGGVRSVVVWDLDYSDNELVEAELAFFAQDTQGNVWRMGEYPEEYDGKKMVANPAWLHGLQEAQAGIMMQATPAPGTRSYSQGWGPAVNWTDRATVDSVTTKACVKAGCYDDCIVIAETSQAEAAVDAHQLKHYARNVGNVYVGWRGAGEKTKETLELVKFEQLDAKALAAARTKALKLEASAYKNSPDLYGKTPPSKPASGS